ncbi:MAG: gamma-glutamyl-gamma-aminobutyrate hydrolase family protein [Rhodospirillales bacterium]|nr:gamma-glutamyl-gamma-aminobutyrate hydrolase family protein [Rhodospirillales bacterium]
MITSTNKPVIGITADSEKADGYSKFPWMALRENYAGAVSRAGGLPIVLPPDEEQASAYLAIIAGLIITGGDFDVDPALYGDGKRHKSVTLKEDRTNFEFAITRAALEKDMPILAICGGQQLLNVVLGGTLIQHIPDEVPAALAHEQPNPRDEPGHEVKIEPGTLLMDIIGQAEISVNSAHHQAVKAVSGSARINASAPDGVVEGIEAPAQHFCLGVQWHPEFEITQADQRLFAAFVHAARN